MPLVWTDLEDIEAPLRYFLSTRCRDDSEIDDIVQETFLRCARYRERLRHPDKLRSWAFRIAANVLLDRIRKETRLDRQRVPETTYHNLAAPETLEEEPVMCLAGLPLMEDEVGELVDGALERLKELDRELVEQYYLGRPGPVSVSDSIAKVRLYRARQRMAIWMSGELRRRRDEAELPALPPALAGGLS